MTGASATPSGSRATHEAAERLHPTGFDPSRFSRVLDALTLLVIRGWPNTPVHNARCVYDVLGWDFDERDAALIRAEAITRHAIATEARRAETPKSGLVHEGAGPKDIAQ